MPVADVGFRVEAHRLLFREAVGLADDLGGDRRLAHPLGKLEAVPAGDHFIPAVQPLPHHYVLRLDDSLIVKHVGFNEISKEIRIISENPRCPDRVESADSQAVEVLGKVYGWVHAHPY